MEALPSEWFLDRTWCADHLIVETKGRWFSADRGKHLLIRDQLPWIDIRFVFMRAATPLYKGSPTSYADWCDRKGFIWAEKTLPSEWFENSE